MKHTLKKTFRAWWSVLLATGFLCGCASTKQFVPKPSVEKPTSDKALIVIERSSAYLEGVTGVRVYDNNKFIGEIGAGGKMVWLRNPGLMNIQVGNDINGPIGSKYFTAKAGESYRYNIVKLHNLDGPGIDTLCYNYRGNIITDRKEDQIPEGSLVFFGGAFPIKVRVIGVQLAASQGVLTIVDVKTGKSIEVPFEGQKQIALFLPLGEYCILKYTTYKDGGTYSTWKTYDINAEFSITKPNVGVYVGNITVSSDNKPFISKDSTAAREFLRQINIDLPYTEAIMETNR
jgi:hypothetical protein